MKVLVTQSDYLPWRGYFAAMRHVDRTVLLDSAQYTRRDWRNRNRIRRPDGGVRWISVPVETKGRFTQSICETRIAESGWAASHRGAIEAAYRAHPYWDELRQLIEIIERVAERTGSLSELNRLLLDALRADLGVAGVCRVDCTGRSGSATDKLVAIAREHGAQTYVSGPRARSYIEDDRFDHAGIEVEYLDYAALPPDPEGLCDGGELSIVDLIAREGMEGAARLCRFGELAAERQAR